MRKRNEPMRGGGKCRRSRGRTASKTRTDRRDELSEETVQAFDDYVKDLRTRLMVWMEDNNVSQAAFAELLGYKTPWTINRFVDDELKLDPTNDNHRGLLERIEGKLLKPNHPSLYVDEKVHEQGPEEVKVTAHRLRLEWALENFQKGRCVQQIEPEIQDALNWTWDQARAKVRMCINALADVGDGFCQVIDTKNWTCMSEGLRTRRTEEVRSLADLAAKGLRHFSTHPAFSVMIESYRNRALAASGMIGVLDSNTAPSDPETFAEGMSGMVDVVSLDEPTEAAVDRFRLGRVEGPLNNPMRSALRDFFFLVDRSLEHDLPGAAGWAQQTLGLYDVWPANVYHTVLRRIQGHKLKPVLRKYMPEYFTDLSEEEAQ